MKVINIKDTPDNWRVDPLRYGSASSGRRSLKMFNQTLSVLQVDLDTYKAHYDDSSLQDWITAHPDTPEQMPWQPLYLALIRLYPGATKIRVYATYALVTLPSGPLLTVRYPPALIAWQEGMATWWTGDIAVTWGGVVPGSWEVVVE